MIHFDKTRVLRAKWGNEAHQSEISKYKIGSQIGKECGHRRTEHLKLMGGILPELYKYKIVIHQAVLNYTEAAPDIVALKNEKSTVLDSIPVKLFQVSS